MLCCPCCGALSHVRCLAARMLQDSCDDVGVIPLEGSCPAHACGSHLLWSNLVREVCAYQPPSTCKEGDYFRRTSRDEYGGEEVNGPLVWRVDDSSDDEEEEDDRTSDNNDNASVVETDAPILGTQESSDDDSSNDVAFDGAMQTSKAADVESDSDDSFWRLDGSCTQKQAALPYESKKSGSTRDAPIFQSPQVERACARVISRNKGNGFCGTEDEGDEGGLSEQDELVTVTPKVSLIERLRLKRLLEQG